MGPPYPELVIDAEILKIRSVGPPLDGDGVLYDFPQG